MSTVIILENLVKLIEINADRLAKGKSTICRTDKGEVVRDYLPCANKNEQGEYLIKCEDCPFSSVEAAKETITELQEEIIKKEKVWNILKGIPNE